LTHDCGRPWSHRSVFNILTNPKYAGCNVWHRSTLRLHDKRKPVTREKWIMKPSAFVPIVDQDTFDRAQRGLPRAADYVWSNDEILRRVRRLLKLKGRLSESLLDTARGMPSLHTIYKRFGTCRQLYERVGYRIPSDVVFASEQAQRALSLRKELIETITALFPGNVVSRRISPRHRAVLLIDGASTVSVLLCRSERKKRKHAKLYWIVEPPRSEQLNVTLLCTMNRIHDRVLNYYVFPRMDLCKSHRLRNNDPFLRAAVGLSDLSEFYVAVKKVLGERARLES
jgi:hypothetical protein